MLKQNVWTFIIFRKKIFKKDSYLLMDLDLITIYRFWMMGSFKTKNIESSLWKEESKVSVHNYIF